MDSGGTTLFWHFLPVLLLHIDTTGLLAKKLGL
jgi:hypothetical protein